MGRGVFPLLDEPLPKAHPPYEKTDLSYCALLHLAAMITLNKIMSIYG
jgi:hypothetical protein